jgi:hypothetical protein
MCKYGRGLVGGLTSKRTVERWDMIRDFLRRTLPKTGEWREREHGAVREKGEDGSSFEYVSSQIAVGVIKRVKDATGGL